MLAILLPMNNDSAYMFRLVLAFGCIPALSLDTAHSDLGEHLLAVYSGWKLLDNYDTYASVFVALFNGFMSLTSYFDVMYRY